MKKLFLLLMIFIFIMFSTNVSAELKKGDWAISPKTGFHYSDSRVESSNESNIIIKCSIALKTLLTNNFALGCGYNLEDGDNFTVEEFLIEGTFYFLPENQFYHPYIGIGLGIFGTDSSFTDYEDGTIYGGELGILCFFNKYIALNSGLSYFINEYDHDPELRTRNINLDIGILIKFGPSCR